jgi:hypothetical protein
VDGKEDRIQVTDIILEVVLAPKLLMQGLLVQSQLGLQVLLQVLPLTWGSRMLLGAG